MNKAILYLSFFARSVAGLVLIKIIASYFSIQEIVAINNITNVVALVSTFSILYLNNYLITSADKLLLYTNIFRTLIWLWFSCVLLSCIIFFVSFSYNNGFLPIAAVLLIVPVFGVTSLINCHLVYRQDFSSINLYLLIGAITSIIFSLLAAFTSTFLFAIAALIINLIAPLFALAWNESVRQYFKLLMSQINCKYQFYWPYKSMFLTMFSMSMAPVVAISIRQQLVSNLDELSLTSWELYYRISSFLLIFLTQPLSNILAKDIGPHYEKLQLSYLLSKNKFFLFFTMTSLAVFYITGPLFWSFFELNHDIMKSIWGILLTSEAFRIASWLISFIFLLRAKITFYIFSEMLSNVVWMISANRSVNIIDLSTNYFFVSLAIFFLNFTLLIRYVKTT